MKTTILRLNGPVAQIELRVQSRLSRKLRHEIALSFFKSIKPWLKYFKGSSIRATEDMSSREQSPREPSCDFSQFGFEIRMKRLEAGLSQAELAKKIGVSRPHLSEIERGCCEIRESTRRSLQEALNPTNLTFSHVVGIKQNECRRGS